jgi:flagellar biosynthesis protein FlhB
LADKAVARLGGALALLLQEAATTRIENEADTVMLLQAVALVALAAVGPIIAVFMVAGAGASIIQNAPVPVLKRIIPDFSRISPSSGLRRLFGSAGLAEMAKTLFRVSAFLLCAAMVTTIIRPELQNAYFSDPSLLLEISRKAALTIVSALLAVSVVLLALDLPTVHGFWRKELRMTQQELKDEHKDSEGDPHLKGRRRAIAKARAGRRNLAAVKNATVVIANPTHFAVAIRYNREQGGAPVVVAKGLDLIALEIRRIAEEISVPVIEDKVLARSLYAKVEVDQMIPIEFYRAVAEILIRLQARRKPRRS